MSFSISNVPKPCKDNSRYSSSSDRQQAPPCPMAGCMRQWHIVKPDGKPNRIWLAQGEKNSPAPKFNVGSSQSSDQIHNDLHLRSPEGQGPAYISTAYWPTLPSRSFLLPALEGRYLNQIPRDEEPNFNIATTYPSCCLETHIKGDEKEEMGISRGVL
jgi:hypothetical protein